MFHDGEDMAAGQVALARQRRAIIDGMAKLYRNFSQRKLVLGRQNAES
jgi:hypothetical protein